MNSSKPSSPHPDPSSVPFIMRIRWTRLILLFILGSFILLLLAIGFENWRGHRTWNQYQQHLLAQGEKLDHKSFLPPPVPDDQNFAATPFLAPLFQFARPPNSGPVQWLDTNAFKRATSLGENLARNQHPSQSGWSRSLKTDWNEIRDWLVLCPDFELDNSGVPLDKPIATPADKIAVAQGVLNVLEPIGPVLDELKSASQRPFSRFDIPYNHDNPFEIILPHLAVVKRVCQLLQSRALAHLALNQTDLAFADLQLMLKVADSTKNEPFMISLLVRFVNFQYALHVLWEGLADRRWSKTQLEEIQKRLATFQFLDEAQHVLRAERAFANEFFDSLHTSKIPNLDQLSGNSSGPGELLIAQTLLRYGPSGWTALEQYNYNRLFQSYLLGTNSLAGHRVLPSQIQKNLDEVQNALHPSQGPLGQFWNHVLVSSLLLPSVESIHLKAAFAAASTEHALAACALEQFHFTHQKYPAHLAELTPAFLSTVPVDPISGKSSPYKLTSNGRFQIHSVGWDEIDSGGQRPAPTPEPPPAKKRKATNRNPHDLKVGDWIWAYP